MKNEITIKNQCPFCGKEHSVNVPKAGYDKWQMGGLIQHAMPELHKMVRESLITRMCLDCLSKTYNCPKPGEDWGEVILKCECCGTSLYARNKQGDNYVCPSCYSNYDGETLEEVIPEGFEDESN